MILVTSACEPKWMSCKTIVKNLIRSYKEAFEDCHIVSISSVSKPEELWRSAEEIYSLKPKKIVFIDHQPHPRLLLEALDRCYEGRGTPDIYIHIYGDFSLYPKDWMLIQPILKKLKVKIICASLKQKNFIENFLLEGSGESLSVFPFPLDSDVFHYNKSRRDRGRKKIGLKKNDLAILYSGRLSLQKNVDYLLSCLERVRLSSGLQVKILMAGGFDELGAPLFGIHFPAGFYYQSWRQKFDNLNKKFTQNVHLLGVLDQVELAEVYNAADLFVSLSLHHDEDFGMAAAEALCSGLPAVLTSWAGYSSFSLDNENCNLVSVQISEKGLALSGEKVTRAVNDQLKKVLETDLEERRARCSKKYCDQFSISSNVGRLKSIYKNRPPAFKGFNCKFEEYVESYKGGLPYPLGAQKGTFYEDIYRPYAD